MSLFALTRPFIHWLEPETAHNLGLWALQRNLMPATEAIDHPSLQVNAFGLNFKNPVGLAAGFDKNAVAINALLGQGFGFVEAGTVTPRAQPGNPQPRIFRLPEHQAVINRLGFNNNGLETYVKHFTGRDKSKGIAGANIGKNKDSADAVADYILGLKAVYSHADYITVNISSPNTPGLRDLQHEKALVQLLQSLQQARETCQQVHGRRVPLLVKIAPDLSLSEQESIARSALTYGIDGLIISNTTISRPDSLKSPHAKEQGGLSGRPLFELSKAVLNNIYRFTGGKLPLIGVGGIASAADAYAKIRAGATLVQLYTALVYQGFSVVTDIQKGLIEFLKKDGFTNITQAIGADSR